MSSRVANGRRLARRAIFKTSFLRARNSLRKYFYRWRTARNRYWPAAVLVLVVLLCLASYWPGLTGGFLFDDHVNLNALGRYGGVRDLQTLLFYLTSGIADPTGRPLSMASFLLDARNWPADPFPFKRTNLFIHATNGVLLYGLLVAMGNRLTGDAKHVSIAALIATALWLFNPLWVSTVLYVVQRHAMLAATFVLAGARAWVGSRNAFENGRTGLGWTLAILAVPVFGTLAGLSKANGFLLPLLLAVLELTVLRVYAPRGPSRIWAGRLFVWLPSILLLGCLSWYAMQIGMDSNHGRPWTLGQRLLTQPRALLQYLWDILIPKLSTIGVFTDGFTHSQSWREPLTTLPAVLAVIALGLTFWMLRKRAPVVAVALGFFLAGHILESSVVMLELYFEHRNYLPATLLFWPSVWYMTFPGRLYRWLTIALVAYATLMALTTAAQARLWGDPLALALVWAKENPESSRAQTHASHQERLAGRQSAADRRLSSLVEAFPYEPQFALSLLDLRCEMGRVRVNDVASAVSAINASGGVQLDVNYHWVSAALLSNSSSFCSQLPVQTLYRLVIAATAQQSQAEDAEITARSQRLFGLASLRSQDCEGAVRAFDARVAAQPRPEFVQSQTYLLATHCGPTYALAHLERYLNAGSPISRAPSPMLRLRDDIMSPWWNSHWHELQQTLVSEIGDKRED